jgi:hypothetical protein
MPKPPPDKKVARRVRFNELGETALRPGAGALGIRLDKGAQYPVGVQTPTKPR